MSVLLLPPLAALSSAARAALRERISLLGIEGLILSHEDKALPTLDADELLVPIAHSRSSYG